MTRLRWQLLLAGGFVAIFAFLSTANLFSEQTRIDSPLLPDKGLRLGLDLRGGIHWVLGVKLDAAEAQQENKAALREYTWQSRTEIKLKGESKNVKVEQVRYDLDGALQKTPIAGTDEQPEQEATGGRRRRGSRFD